MIRKKHNSDQGYPCHQDKKKIPCFVLDQKLSVNEQGGGGGEIVKFSDKSFGKVTEIIP